ncbi:MAG: DUF2589 domain-containing protein [Desulfovibrio sp.]|uniref:DUF2589 domain-containing protein n=1 Tax=Desulfovibrio sp. TaxID=885 RepID=UPI0025BEF17F|nr:DUF2589 domain-containing protein [Desulfovibrio sp.]MCI7569236.1 DUF2589 domain-containing protein [Desulfovibrio sp.]
MSRSVSLQALVSGIAGAVIRAQEQIEAAQLTNLLSYFYRKKGQKGYFPLSMRINLPSQRPDAKPGETDSYRVPFLSALPYNALRIKQVEVDFSVDFATLSEADGEMDNGADMLLPTEDTEDNAPPGNKDFSRLMVDMGSLKKGQGAHVKLVLESTELPESTARLINELIKTGQTYDTAADEDDK